MTQHQHLPQARENAQRTYDRRAARAAADKLATIPPNRWDPETKRIICTLATIAAPSRIDDALEAFDGAGAGELVEIETPDAADRIARVQGAGVPFEPIECKHGVAGYRGVETCAEGGHDV